MSLEYSFFDSSFGFLMPNYLLLSLVLLVERLFFLALDYSGISVSLMTLICFLIVLYGFTRVDFLITIRNLFLE